MSAFSLDMVGIVLISHSIKLAEGVQELAQQMVQAPVQIAIAAGVDDPENPFGTDVMQIHAAIESVYSNAGVVALMDLGSAVMGAEMALEFFTEEQRRHIRLCAAPLVEGAIAAVVQAAAGAELEQVVAEARGALAAKAEQLGELGETGTQGGGEALLGEGQGLDKQEIRLIVQNPLGIHARPAAQFVTTAGRFQSEITVRNVTRQSPPVSAKSINQVVTLGVLQGHEIEIVAQGIEAEAALAALRQLVAGQFGEAERGKAEGRRQRVEGGKVEGKRQKAEGGKVEGIRQRAEGRGQKADGLAQATFAEEKGSAGPLHASAGARLQGIPASPGVAVGSVILYHSSMPDVIDEPVDNPQMAWEQLQGAVQVAQRQIQDIIRTVEAASAEGNNASIFQAHLLYLEDPALMDRVREMIFEQYRSAAIAWKAVIEDMVKTYQALEDSYLQARATDVQDVGQRVLKLLLRGDGQPSSIVKNLQPGILVAPDLTPSDAAQLHPDQVLGVCTVAGSATAHSALIANMLGIPMVVGVGEDLLALSEGVPLALDGSTGQIWLHPSDSQKQTLIAKQSPAPPPPRSPAPLLCETLTLDGRSVPVIANILGLASAQLAIEQGAAGVGLLRTEFLYLDRLAAPSEEEQLEAYQEIATVLGDRPLTIRTVDIGGDKPIPYMNLASEANPFLGWRGIRQSLDCPNMLKTQLRAILRASHGHAVQVMFPMVSSRQEVRAATAILREAQEELSQAEIAFDPGIKVGIMIEIPAAVMMADQLALEVDFFSLGTNDLGQYAMAADRSNPQVAPLADGLAPAVLRMIQRTVTAAHEAGIKVSVCGQLASDPVATPILLGLGIDELSVNPPAIAAVKSVISQWRMAEAEAIAREAQQLDSAIAVRECVGRRSS